ncbi:MAG: hypothetical protein KKF80_03945, partial [Candidatus Omnitrophica bacterium]|nr:hypothetical protein [Candidatus Omnitrophota bacterium]
MGDMNSGGPIATSRSFSVSLILLVVSLGANVFFRLAPAYFPQYKKDARSIVEQRIAAASIQTLTQKYPGYGARVRHALIRDIIKKESRSKEFHARILEEYAALCEPYQDKDHQTYLLELDPYQWMRNTENVLRYGFPGTKREGALMYDTYMLAPRGIEIGHIHFLFYCSAALYRVFSFFFPATGLAHFLFYLPLFYTVVFLTSLYFFSKQYFSSFGAFCTTLYVGCNSLFINRSCAGWYDYDALSMTMPLIVLGCVGASIRYGRSSGRYWAWLACAAFFQGMYTFTWIGWWFLLFIIIAAFLFIILNNYVLYERRRAHALALHYVGTLTGFLIGSALFCLLISKVNMLAEFMTLLRENLTLGKSASVSLWPDMRYTISELQGSSFLGAVKNLYGGVIMSIVLIANIWIYTKERRGKHACMVYVMFFWAVFMIYASMKGARFIIYLVIPFGFFFGWAVSEALRILRERARLHFRAASAGFAVTGIIIIFMLTRFLQTGFISSRNDYPLMNDEWYEAMQQVKMQTPPGSVINSWWDYGNFFKAVADRPVIFDGQSQLGSLGYWMGRVLLARDENEALRILRMLNNASDTTFGALQAHIHDQFKTERMLEEILTCDRLHGDEVLRTHGIPQVARQRILDDLHRVPGPAYFVVDKSMAGKMANISFIGNWIFPKVFITKNSALPEKELFARLEDIYKLSPAQAKAYYEEVLVSGLHADGDEILSKRFSFYTTPITGT